jgi:hypothetical protein
LAPLATLRNLSIGNDEISPKPAFSHHFHQVKFHCTVLIHWYLQEGKFFFLFFLLASGILVQDRSAGRHGEAKI